MEKRVENWLSDADNMKFVDFLVERTKNVKEVMSVVELTREFIAENSPNLQWNDVRNRFRRFFPIIHEMPHLETETKVKMMFALSCPLTSVYFYELKKGAEVNLDESHRIIHYKTHEGLLELEGVHKRCHNNVSDDEILQFMAEKVKKRSGVVLWGLARQFKEETGNSQHTSHLQRRFTDVKDWIYESELFDKDLKIQMMFAMKTVIPDYVLKELQDDAIVTLDKKNQIKEYRKNDGSLILKKATRARQSLAPNEKRRKYEESSDEENSDDDDMEPSSSSRNEKKRRTNMAPIVEPKTDFDKGSELLMELIKIYGLNKENIGEVAPNEEKEETPSKSTESAENIPLTHILDSLNVFIVHLNSPALSDLKKRVEDGKEGKQDKVIPATKIRDALQNAIDEIMNL